MTGITVIKKRSFGSFAFDATFVEDHTAESVVTEEPIELGAEISDHMYAKSIELIISAGVDDKPFGLSADTGDSNEVRSSSTYEALLNLKNTAELFNIQTGLKLYDNMVVYKIAVRQDKNTPDSFYFDATCRQLSIVQTQSTEAPASQYPPNSKTQDQAAPVEDHGTTVGGDVPAQATNESAILHFLH